MTRNLCTAEPSPFPSLIRLLLLVCLTAWSGCASHPSLPPPPRHAPAQSQPHRLPEEFDPQTLNEDLLLIQPNFGPEAVSLGTSSQERAPVPQPSSAQASAHESPADTDEDSRLAVSPRTRQVYAVQVLALSRAQTAKVTCLELQERLGVPAWVDTARGLFLVRAGECATVVAASELKKEIIALGPQYAEAFTVKTRRPLASPSPMPVPMLPEATPDSMFLASPAAVAAPDTTSAPLPRLIRAFGWRVLLDKTSSYDQARKLRERAIHRLHRTDMDITFKAPWYNVELGNYRTESDAQQALEQLKRRFPHALLIRGQIQIPAED